MLEDERKKKILAEVQREIETLGEIRQTLIIIVGLDAIRDNELHIYVAQLYDQIRSGRAAAIEKGCSSSMVQLIQDYFEPA